MTYNPAILSTLLVGESSGSANSIADYTGDANIEARLAKSGCVVMPLKKDACAVPADLPKVLLAREHDVLNVLRLSQQSCCTCLHPVERRVRNDYLF